MTYYIQLSKNEIENLYACSVCDKVYYGNRNAIKCCIKKKK